MKKIITAYLAQKLDDGNMSLVFMKGKVGEEDGLTELGKQIVNVETRLAGASRNEENIVSKDGNTSKACEYVTFDGNMYEVINFSDRVALATTSQYARKYVAESTISFECDEKYLVSPEVHAGNLALLNAKFKKAENQFNTKAIDKTDYLLTSFNELYKDDDTFIDVSVSNSDASVKKQVVFLRKIKLKDAALEAFYTESNNYSDKEEYTQWLIK